MLGRLGNMGVLPVALAAANLAVPAALEIFKVGTGLWYGSEASTDLEKKIREQKVAQIEAETQQKIALAQAQRQAQANALYAVTSRQRTGQTVALFVVGGLAMGISGYLIYKALKKRGA